MNFTEKTTEHVLDNGLKILFHPHSGVPSATFMVWYKVGSRNEPKGKTGISHFLEHLSFKRSELFDKGQIVAEVTRNGGNFNAYTSRDFTSYFETFSSSKLELAAIIESQRMHKLMFDDEDRDKEVGVILSEMEKNLDNPYNVLEMELRSKAYHHHPYKNPVIGWEEDVRNTTTEDLKAYYEKFYASNNATVVVVGNFNQNNTLELIKKYFGNIPPKEIEQHIKREEQQNRQRKIKVKKAGSSSIIKLAYHIPEASNKDVYPLLVLGEMLNLGVSSRMYQSLVETQLLTDVAVNVEVSKDPGLFTLMGTLYPNASHAEAEEKILEQIKELTNSKSPTQEELEKTKRRIKSSYEFNRDGTYRLAYLLGYYETVGSHKFIEDYVENVEKVTIDDLRRVTEEYIYPDNCSIGHFIPSHIEIKKPAASYDYVPQETTHHIYRTPPIIISESIAGTPIEFKKKTLKNGIRVLVTENKVSDTVKLHGTIGAGNLFISKINPMLPTMCAGMLNRGSAGKSKFEIANEIESRGASVGISSVSEAVNFSLSSTADDFSCVLGILAQILRKPDFPEDELDKYQKFSVAGIRQKKSSPGYLGAKAFSQIVYPRGHMYYNYSLATQESHVLKVSRDDIVNFYNNYYSPHTMIFGISGNINAEEVFNQIESHFGDWERKEVPEPYLKSVELQKEYIEKTIFVEDKTEAEVIFGHYGGLSRSNPDYHKAMVMNFILGGSGALSSRIGRRIREDLGLVYSITSAFTALLVPGAWSVKYGVDNHYVDLSIKALKEEIHNFIENGIEDNELDLAKSYLTGAYPLRFANNNGIARSLLINEFYDLGDEYLDNYPEIINSITKAEVNEAAKKYLHPEVATVIKAGTLE